MSKTQKSYWLYILLGFSLVFNLLVFSMDTVPFIWPKIENKILKKQANAPLELASEKEIVSRALEIAHSKKPLTIWEEPKGITEAAFNYIINRNGHEFKIYNYPKAFLYYGLSEYLINNKDEQSLQKFKILFDQLIDENGSPKFTFDKVDQVPFALASLNLYKKYKETKYRAFCDKAFELIIQNTRADGLVLYRKDSDVYLDDLLGMIIPFLVEYHQLTENPQALLTAKNQLNFYIRYGVDKETLTPSHGVALASKIKVGSMNWGRGIGWYLFGLTALEKNTSEYSNEYSGIYKSLTSLRNKESLWSQFPGSSEAFDASATTMFMYSFSLIDKSLYTKADVLKLLSPHISRNGTILSTSGDTYGLNEYSKSFGESELSQGVLLLLLSNVE